MNQPSMIVRVTGNPLIGIPVGLCGVWLIFMSAQGEASLWLGLMGVAITFRIISSIKSLNRYKAWRKQWDSMGSFGAAPERPPTGAWRWATVLASALFVGAVVYYPNAADNPELQHAFAWLLLLCSIFLVARLVVGVRNFFHKRRRRNDDKAKPEVEPVSWMISTTVDSPSREWAVRSLPDYAGRILSR